MTERTDLGRLVTAWLEAEAPPRASERVLAATIARVAMTPQRRTLGEWLIGDRFRISPTLRLALLGALLVLGLLGGALIAAALLRESEAPPSTSSYEAVFLRNEGLTGPGTELIVVGVDSEGIERQIAHLPDAVLRPEIAFFPPEKVVSPSGLLAVPISRDAGRNYHLEILDLRDPQAKPIVIEGISDVVWGDAFWGPGDQLAIAWYELDEEDDPSPGAAHTTSASSKVHFRFIEARTGSTIAVERPYDVEILDHWAADGSGVLVKRRGDGGLAVLRSDGTTVEATEEATEGVLGSRHQESGAGGASIELWAGAEIRAWVSPESIVRPESVVATYADGDQLLVLPAGVEATDAAWTADGLGLWLVTRRDGGEKGNGVDERVERWTPDSGHVTVTTAGKPLGRPCCWHPNSFARWRGLAPDDSMLVVTSHWTADTPVDAVVIPDSGARFAVEALFAGWLEVDR